jgi:ribosomal protein L31E
MAKREFKYEEEIEEDVWGRGRRKICRKVRIKKAAGARR